MKKPESQIKVSNSTDDQSLGAKKAYIRPQILSVEKLEAAAAACPDGNTPPQIAAGKGAFCTVLGS